MKKVYRGVAEGNVIRLETPLNLPQGTQILVNFTTVHREKQEEIKQRQLQLLEKGFHLGDKLYAKREELHEREAD